MSPRCDATDRPRYLPQEPWPPYAHVPGRTPHPVSDPAGHQFGAARPRPAPPDPRRWQECRAFLRGVDLFNHGFYWEAHEEWESLWHACGRAGPVADVLKGLIRLAAAGVKARTGTPRGVADHAAGAAALFRRAAGSLGGEGATVLGLCLADLLVAASAAARLAEVPPADAGEGSRVVFDFVLRPGPFPGPGGEG
jgi:hypothetical protein